MAQMKFDFNADCDNDVLIKRVKDAIDSKLTPLELLRKVVRQYGAPIFTFDNPFKIDGENLCYGVYIDPHVDVENFEDDFRALQKSMDTLYNGELGYYVSVYIGTDEKLELAFVNHFLNAIGLTFDEVKYAVKQSIIKSIAAE